MEQKIRSSVCRKWLMWGLMSVGIFMLGCQKTTSESAAQPDAISESVDSLLTQYQTAIGTGNHEHLLSLYSDDSQFHWIEDGRIVYRSKQGVQKGLEGLGKMYPDASLELRETRIIPLPPDYAHISTQFTQYLADSTGEAFSFSGTMTMMAARTSAGWKILSGHTSTQKQRR